MKLKQKLDTTSRGFIGLYICEFCQWHSKFKSSYDKGFKNKVEKMVCGNCGKSELDEKPNWMKNT